MPSCQREGHGHKGDRGRGEQRRPLDCVHDLLITDYVQDTTTSRTSLSTLAGGSIARLQLKVGVEVGVEYHTKSFVLRWVASEQCWPTSSTTVPPSTEKISGRESSSKERGMRRRSRG